jgi:hypothetical protein
MSLYLFFKSIKNTKLFKRILSIILFLIIFDKLVISILLLIYYIIFNKKPLNQIKNIQKKIYPDNYIKYYLENNSDYTYKYNFTLLTT